MWSSRILIAALLVLQGAARADDDLPSPSPTPDPAAAQAANADDEERAQAKAEEQRAQAQADEARAQAQAEADRSRAEDAVVDDDTADRERFLEARLKAGVKSSTLWQVAIASGYGLGMLTQTTRAVIETRTSVRADLIVSASKAAIGVVSRLARPPSAMFGTRELDSLPSSTSYERRLRLAQAEAMLRRNAKECDNRYSWIAHTVNIALNVAGGLIVWLGYHDLTTAATSTAVGIAVGELQIWSQPWRPKRDWAEYRRRFGSVASHQSAEPPRRSLVLLPAVGANQQGAAMKLNF